MKHRYRVSCLVAPVQAGPRPARSASAVRLEWGQLTVFLAPVAAGREIARGDRARGMAASQADMVHRGVSYDLEVDTTQAEPLACARTIAAHVADRACL